MQLHLSDADTLDASARTAAKRPYAKPRLTFFGKVQDLTLGGGSVIVEQVNGSNKCSQNAAAPCVIPSDPLVKHRVRQVGSHPLGIGLYLFEYKPGFEAFGRGVQFGVMADEVERVLPAAVVRHPSGIRAVDYAALGIEQAVH